MHTDAVGSTPARAAGARSRGRAPIARALALALLLALVALPALAQDGELLLEKGSVLVRHAGDVRMLQQAGARAPLYAGDEVRSGGDTSAVITLKATQDAVTLYEHTSFAVESVSPASSRFGLNMGKAFFKAVAALGGGKRFEVATPTAVIGVKGTEFVVGTDGNDTFLLTLSGVVGIVSQAFREIEVATEADFASAVRAGQPPAPPVPVPAETRERIVKEPGLGGFKSLELKTGEGSKKQEKNPVVAVTGAQEQVKASTEKLTGGPSGPGSIKFRIVLW
jgi:hypothetical protein